METYLISVDFGGIVPNVGQLDKEISISSITKNLYGVTTYDDTVDIYFDATLSAPEKIELDAIVAAHIPVYTPATPYSLNLIPRQNNFTKSSYQRLAANVFPETTYATAKCVSYMDSSATSYSIQIYDKNNRQTLAEETFTNTEESVQDLGVLNNLPSLSTQIEILCKVNGKKAYLESVIICYN